MRAWIGEPDYEAAARSLYADSLVWDHFTDRVREMRVEEMRPVVDAALASMTQTEVGRESRFTDPLLPRHRWVSEWIEVTDE